MRLQVKGKNVEVTPSIREYAERKLAKLDEAARRTDPGRGRALGAEEPLDRGEPGRRGDDLHQGPDPAGARGIARHEGVDRLLVDKLERQVKRYRERRIVEPRRTGHHGDNVERPSA